MYKPYTIRRLYLASLIFIYKYNRRFKSTKDKENALIHFT